LGIYIGIDGGGTKTEVVALDVANRLSRRVAGSPSNPNSVGWDTSLQTMSALVADALRGLVGQEESRPRVAGICVALAGVDRAEQVERMTRFWTTEYPGAAVQVVNDAAAALTAGTKGGPGIVLIAGTGSIAFGETADGHTARAGGYGYLIGDEGSGFDIGRQGMLAALQWAEGRGDETVLWHELQEYLGIKDPKDVIAKVYQARHPIGVVASFAPRVLAAAPRDAVAARIVAAAVEQYVGLIRSVAERLGFKDGASMGNTVVLSGGLFAEGTGLQGLLADRLPGYHFVRPKHSAAAGALLRILKWASGQRGNAGLPMAEDELVELWSKTVRPPRQ
jgi:N-acetylglucosamine kinase-like BadF-type ATPase